MTHLQAEAMVIDRLRELQSMHRVHADRLMDRIAREFLNSSPNNATAGRRAWSLLKLAAEGIE